MSDTLQQFSYRSGAETLFAGLLGDPSAPPVVLLHPTPLDGSFWLPVAQLVSGYRFILPDLRGHGRSPLGVGDTLTTHQLALDALALLDTLELAQATFVGCSIGGYTLYELWRRAPERVRALGFFSSKPHPDSPANTATRLGWIAGMEARDRAGKQGPGDDFIEAMVTTLTGRQLREEQPGALDELRVIIRRNPPSHIAAIQRGLAALLDSRGTAGTIQVPTLVVAGEEDGSITPAELAELADLVRVAGAPVSSHVLAKAGHYAPWEQPEATAALLEAFLGSLPPH